jgi:hypothetical protein
MHVNFCSERGTVKTIRRGRFGPIGSLVLCESSGAEFALPILTGLEMRSLVERPDSECVLLSNHEALPGFYIRAGRSTPRVCQELESSTEGRSMRKTTSRVILQQEQRGAVVSPRRCQLQTPCMLQKITMALWLPRGRGETVHTLCIRQFVLHVLRRHI